MALFQSLKNCVQSRSGAVITSTTTLAMHQFHCVAIGSRFSLLTCAYNRRASPHCSLLIGNEWIHWGHPPCGAKRHMDLTCTSRVSVQIAGSKEWRLYPIVTGGESNFWKEVLVIRPVIRVCIHGHINFSVLIYVHKRPRIVKYPCRHF